MLRLVWVLVGVRAPRDFQGSVFRSSGLRLGGKPGLVQRGKLRLQEWMSPGGLRSVGKGEVPALSITNI